MSTKYVENFINIDPTEVTKQTSNLHMYISDF
jgi:hypothetical protein